MAIKIKGKNTERKVLTEGNINAGATFKLKYGANNTATIITYDYGNASHSLVDLSSGGIIMSDVSDEEIAEYLNEKNAVEIDAELMYKEV